MAKKRRSFSPEHRARISAALRGRAHSSEHVAKVAAANRGRSPSAETRAKIAAALSGRPGRTPTPETLAKMSAAQRGRTFSAEARAKMSAVRKGRRLSPDTRAKMSAAQKGRTFSSEHRAKIAAAKKGRPHSAEARAKMSAALRGRRSILAALADQFETFLKLQAQGSNQGPTTRPKSATSKKKSLPAVQLGKPGDPVFVRGVSKGVLTAAQYKALKILLRAFARGLTAKEMTRAYESIGWRNTLRRLRESDPDWAKAIGFPGDKKCPDGLNNYRVLPW
jgi:hypothetical protein